MPCTKNYVGWAIYIGPAEKASSHRNEENIRCVVQQDAKRPAPRVPSRGWRFFAQKKSLPPSNKFFIALGFSSFSPGVFFVISKGGAEEPSRLRAHKPLPHTFIQYSKIAVEAKGPRPVSKGGLLATAG
jgi:hypothetical protein